MSNPTPVYVVKGGEAVLQCGFESSIMLWQMYNVDSTVIIANEGHIKDGSKYSVSKNPSSGLYYRLTIKNVGVSDAKKYRCVGNVEQEFYFVLDLLGRCNHSCRTIDIMGLSVVTKKKLFCS